MYNEDNRQVRKNRAYDKFFTAPTGKISEYSYPKSDFLTLTGPK
jgi:hypothetical protein